MKALTPLVQQMPPQCLGKGQVMIGGVQPPCSDSLITHMTYPIQLHSNCKWFQGVPICVFVRFLHLFVSRQTTVSTQRSTSVSFCHAKTHSQPIEKQKDTAHSLRLYRRQGAQWETSRNPMRDVKEPNNRRQGAQWEMPRVRSHPH